MDKLKIFISGTQDDIKPERDAVDRAVNATKLAKGIRAETAASQPQSPRAWIEQQIRECNIYIGVYSHCYGWVIPEDDRSATEFEFDLATQLNKTILIWIRKLQAQEKSLPDFERQELFLKRVSDFTKGKLRQQFETTVDLEKMVVDALGEMFIEFIQKYTAQLALGTISETKVESQRLGYRAYAEKLVTDLREWEHRYAPMFAKFEKLDLFGQFTSGNNDPQPLLTLIKQNRRIVILGVAGAGKTTTLRRIALDSAQNFLGGQPEALIPALISLRDYGPTRILRLIESKFRSWGLTFDELREHLERRSSNHFPQA